MILNHMVCMITKLHITICGYHDFCFSLKCAKIEIYLVYSRGSFTHLRLSVTIRLTSVELCMSHYYRYVCGPYREVYLQLVLFKINKIVVCIQIDVCFIYFDDYFYNSLLTFTIFFG